MNKTCRHLGLLILLVIAGPALAEPGVSDHEINLQLFPEQGEIEILDRISVSQRDEFRFRLAPWMRIISLSLDGKIVHAEPQGQEFRIGINDRNRHLLEFRLRGSIPSRDAKQSLSSHGEGGIFLPGYAAWIPLENDARMRYRLELSLPLPHRAVATGRLLSEEETQGIYRASFETRQAGGAPSLFSGIYQVTERIHQGLRLRTYFHSELAALATDYLDAAQTYIERYAVSIGAYPYSDFHIVSAPLPVGLGFPNLTYVGRRVLPLPFMRTRSLAHEILHSWWGNGVAVDYASGNWSEGLTTYLADYALAEDQGASAARDMRVRWLRDFAALPPARDRPVRDFVSKRHQASQVIGYNKVAFIFHMLKREISPAVFEQGLRLFWRRHQHRRAGWRDLQAAFEQASSRDLGWFFEQWLERRGAPRLSLVAHSVERVGDTYLTRFEVLQPVTGYRFKLPLRLSTELGEREYDIDIEETLTRVELRTSGRPVALQLDPQSHLFRRLQSDEAPPIMRDIRLDAATRVLVDGEGQDFERIASRLAGSLMDFSPEFVTLKEAQNSAQALLLVTTTMRLTRLRALLGLGSIGVLPQLEHRAAAWTARRANGAPVLVIVADDVTELNLLQRPLPHYGGQSYVLFAAGRALARGIWPLNPDLLRREFDAAS